MDDKYYLEMLDINKTFPGAKVLNHIDFKIKLGEVRALMGENGAGKSTLMKILGGIYQKDKDSGKILIEGQEVEISERSAVTGQYTYLVEPSIAMSGIYRTRQRIRARKGKIKKIEQTDRGFYLLVEIDE